MTNQYVILNANACKYIHNMYLNIYESKCTWNLFVLYFWASTLQNKVFSDQNRGHLGSRYKYDEIYINIPKYKYIYIYMSPCQNSLSAYLSENPGHRSGWEPHRFTWLGDRVLFLVLNCREMPLS